jgi:hypothetical protein
MVLRIQKVPLQDFGKLPAAWRWLPGYPLCAPAESVLEVYAALRFPIS